MQAKVDPTRDNWSHLLVCVVGTVLGLRTGLSRYIAIALICLIVKICRKR